MGGGQHHGREDQSLTTPSTCVRRERSLPRTARRLAAARRGTAPAAVHGRAAAVLESAAAAGAVFMALEWLEQDVEEVCGELGITANNCGVMLHRARMQLRECLNQTGSRQTRGEIQAALPGGFGAAEPATGWCPAGHRQLAPALHLVMCDACRTSPGNWRSSAAQAATVERPGPKPRIDSPLLNPGRTTSTKLPVEATPSALGKNGAMRVGEDTARPKFYVCSMLPYPSGKCTWACAQLHHQRHEARYLRMKGFNVLMADGWMLRPAGRNAAIDNGLPPPSGRAPTSPTEKPDAAAGSGHRLSRELATCDPDYYKWNSCSS